MGCIMTEALEVYLSRIQHTICTQFTIENDPLLFIIWKYQTYKLLITGCFLFVTSLRYHSKSVVFALFQNKSVHFPLRSKYNRLTKVARFLQENPSCLLCNILHHYLHQANYSIIDDATMVRYWSHMLSLKKPLFCWGAKPQGLRCIWEIQQKNMPRNTVI